jgi:hypothetical protein
VGTIYRFELTCVRLNFHVHVRGIAKRRKDGNRHVFTRCRLHQATFQKIRSLQFWGKVPGFPATSVSYWNERFEKAQTSAAYCTYIGVVHYADTTMQFLTCNNKGKNTFFSSRAPVIIVCLWTIRTFCVPIIPHAESLCFLNGQKRILVFSTK